MPKEYELQFDKLSEKIEQMVEKFEQMSEDEREEFLKNNFRETIRDKK